MYVITHLPTKTHFGSHSRSMHRAMSTSHVYGFKTFMDAKYVGDHLATFKRSADRFPKRLEMKQYLETDLTDAVDQELWIERVEQPDAFARWLSLQGLELRMVHLCVHNELIYFQEVEAVHVKTTVQEIAKAFDEQMK